jgi:hypothetical protein
LMRSSIQARTTAFVGMVSSFRFEWAVFQIINLPHTLGLLRPTAILYHKKWRMDIGNFL